MKIPTPNEWRKLHDEVIRLGGLHVIGTERHESRRIDNQLRGRAGRQGDPGSTRFFVSAEDDVIRRFGGDRIRKVMDMVGLGEDVPIENKMVTGTIESAQIRVEGFHFDIRKHLVDYDDVVNTQRNVIYGERRKVLSGADLRANILSMIICETQKIISNNIGEQIEETDMATVSSEINAIMPVPKDLTPSVMMTLKTEELEERFNTQAEEMYNKMEKSIGAKNMRVIERLVMLRVIDKHWVEHLTAMDHMRQGVALQAVAQRDPLAIYKKRERGNVTAK